MRGNNLDPTMILYGSTPSRTGKAAIVQLTPVNTGTRHAYYLDYEGWSGSMAWLVNSPKLPAPLLGSREALIKEPPQDFLDLLEDQNDGSAKLEGYECKFTPDQLDEEYGSILRLDHDQGEDYDLEDAESLVPESFIQAVETLAPRPGYWMTDYPITCLLFYVDDQKQLLGVCWTGSLQELRVEP